MASSIQLLRSTIAQERPFPGNLLEGQPAVNLNVSEPGLFFKAADGSLVKIGPAAITSDGSPPNSSPQGSSGNSAGELWLDKSVDPAVLKVYDGTAWIDAGSGGGGGGDSYVAFTRWTKEATGGETSLSGPDDSGTQLSYTPGLEQVYLNGVLLTRDEDYSADNGTNISNLVSLVSGDLVEVLAYESFTLASIPSSAIEDNAITDFKVAPDAGIKSTKLEFLQSGASALSRLVSSKLKDTVSVKDFGAVGDGIADDTSKIQAAIDAVTATGGEVYFPVGKYRINSTGLLITKNGVYLRGAGIPDRVSKNRGTILIYEGVGLGSCAVKFTATPYARHCGMSGIGIRCQEGTETALYVNTTNSEFTNLEISGQGTSAGPNGAAIRLHQVTSTIFSNIFCDGRPTETSYCSHGISADFNVTTADFYNCYMSQYVNGLYVKDDTSYLSLTNSILESNIFAGAKLEGGYVWLYKTWIEANPRAIYMANHVNLVASGGYWQQVSVDQSFFDVESNTSNTEVIIDKVLFRTDGGTGTKRIFNSTNSITQGKYVLRDCQYTTSGGCTYVLGGAPNTLNYEVCNLGSTSLITYRFQKTGTVSPNIIYNLTLTDTVSAVNARAIMPFSGNVVGFAIYTSAPIEDSGFTVRVVSNDKEVIPLTTPNIPAVGESRAVIKGKVFDNGSSFSDGAELWVQLLTTSSISPATLDVYVDVFVLPSKTQLA